MGYYPDLKKISIEQYKKTLSTEDLIPSWLVLLENMDTNMDLLKKHKIKNLAELKSALKNKRSVLELAEESGVSEKYLTVLRRVINGYHPKPNRIRDFPCLSVKTVTALEKIGIKNTRQLFDKVITSDQRDELSQLTRIDQDMILHLTKLSDLSRIRWVNHTFAYVLCKAEYDTAEKVAYANPEELYKTVNQLNKDKELYNSHIGLRDICRLVQAAKQVPCDIKY